jgi:hypothetical protein
MQTPSFVVPSALRNLLSVSGSEADKATNFITGNQNCGEDASSPPFYRGIIITVWTRFTLQSTVQDKVFAVPELQRIPSGKAHLAEIWRHHLSRLPVGICELAP